MNSFNHLALGEYVYSLAGRDKGMCFVVIALEGNFALLVNGKQRKTDKPKKKKLKHVKSTKDIDIVIAQKIIRHEKLSNSEIRKSISKYLKEVEL